MPLFEYRCPTCHEKFEVRVKHEWRNDPQLCKNCGGIAPRVHGAPHLHGSQNMPNG